jgi:hypothetical protein
MAEDAEDSTFVVKFVRHDYLHRSTGAARAANGQAATPSFRP